MTFRSVTPLLLAAAALPLGGCAISINDPGAPSPSVARAAAATLMIRFEGIETPNGQIMLSVFDNAAAHDGNGAPVPDAVVEIFQTDAAGNVPQESGGLVRKAGGTVARALFVMELEGLPGAQRLRALGVEPISLLTYPA